jgi:hypothetical protein
MREHGDNIKLENLSQGYLSFEIRMLDTLRPLATASIYKEAKE